MYPFTPACGSRILFDLPVLRVNPDGPYEWRLNYWACILLDNGHYKLITDRRLVAVWLAVSIKLGLPTGLIRRLVSVYIVAFVPIYSRRAPGFPDSWGKEYQPILWMGGEHTRVSKGGKEISRDSCQSPAPWKFGYSQKEICCGAPCRLPQNVWSSLLRIRRLDPSFRLRHQVILGVPKRSYWGARASEKSRRAGQRRPATCSERRCASTATMRTISKGSWPHMPRV